MPVFKCSPEGGNISSGLSHVSNPTSLTLQALLMLDNYLSSQSISLRCWSVVTRHWSVQSRGQWARSSSAINLPSSARESRTTMAAVTRDPADQVYTDMGDWLSCQYRDITFTSALEQVVLVYILLGWSDSLTVAGAALYTNQSILGTSTPGGVFAGHQRAHSSCL